LDKERFSAAVLGFDAQRDSSQEMGFYAKKTGSDRA
jgi:hypothetical protein